MAPHTVHGHEGPSVSVLNDLDYPVDEPVDYSSHLSYDFNGPASWNNLQYQPTYNADPLLFAGDFTELPQSSAGTTNTDASHTGSVDSEPAATRTRRNNTANTAQENMANTAMYSCPMFKAETELQIPHSCYGLQGKVPSEVRVHLKRFHNKFAKLCRTCNKIIIDVATFNAAHGKLCNDSRPQKKGDAARAQHEALCKHYLEETIQELATHERKRDENYIEDPSQISTTQAVAVSPTFPDETLSPRPILDSLDIEQTWSIIPPPPGTSLESQQQLQAPHVEPTVNESFQTLLAPAEDGRSLVARYVSIKDPCKPGTNSSTFETSRNATPNFRWWPQTSPIVPSASVVANSSEVEQPEVVPGPPAASDAASCAIASFSSTSSTISFSHSSFSTTTSSAPSSETLRCTDCDAVFQGNYRKGNLARHCRLTHKGKKEYLCQSPDCHQAFRRSDARLKHYRKHHPDLAPLPIERRHQRRYCTDNPY
ncbi:hypothetical protein OPT61_g6506 [Boeremia exigua]|uniref:Uncharacterized protein n=1 Tax=Boeremia exigua TaxID=749465 RepID=A0ACC2I6E4_9PLEO|nr:hypothetical protein OPT61_g6506 [Boeremia exigua]